MLGLVGKIWLHCITFLLDIEVRFTGCQCIYSAVHLHDVSGCYYCYYNYFADLQKKKMMQQQENADRLEYSRGCYLTWKVNVKHTVTMKSLVKGSYRKLILKITADKEMLM